MKEAKNNAVNPADLRKSERPVRPAVQIFIWIICLACVGIVTVHWAWGRTKHRIPSTPSESADVAQAAKPEPVVKSATLKPAGIFSGRIPVRQAAVAPAFHVKPTPESRELVDSLLYLDTKSGALSEAQAAAWKENLKRLIQQGEASVPAISEFLDKNIDIPFGQENSQALGYSSARMAMLDALMQIGSSNAIGALDSVLQNTGGPQEIAVVTQFLEKTQPGVFLQHAFDAAQRVLANVANGSLPGVDVAPLFQVFQQYEYGNAYTVTVLKESAGQWNRYAAIALAQLPDGAGVPALIQIATGQEGNSPGARTAALQALAGMASQSANARETLLGLARQNSLSANDWSLLVPFLAGNQDAFQNSMFGNAVAGINPTDLRGSYIGSNRQSYWTAPLGAMTVSQIAQQSAFVDQMLAVTTDPAAIQALQQARLLLDNRRIMLANSSEK